MAETKQDRELMELLNELRVALPGIQVMFAFLLIVPFSQGFAQVTSTQKNIYFLSFLCTAAATAFLIAPTTYHRLRWREGDKEHMLKVANRYAITGTVFLAFAMTGVVFLITDFLYDSGLAIFATSWGAGMFALLWFGIPLLRRAREKKSD
jgi:predicted membrane channel-forming protein YqfA (hemolysin III family)